MELFPRALIHVGKRPARKAQINLGNNFCAMLQYHLYCQNQTDVWSKSVEFAVTRGNIKTGWDSLGFLLCCLTKHINICREGFSDGKGSFN